MASFTDNPDRIRFNPYIQQMPIEQMAQVGMMRQAKYDEGVQRIQSSIDNVAGMDIIRNVDKQYLQSKLHQLTGDLRVVAAGDFSNFQLVNTVGGMVNRIGKDENVINAVMSTKNHTRQLETIRTAKQKGEWGIENEADYVEQFNKYMNSDKVGEKFSYEYTPFVDVNKKLIDIAKAVGVDESIIPELFATNPDGTLKTDAKGNPEFNPVMAEKHLKGKDPAKMLTAFKTALTAADYNQLAITGKYRYKGVSADDLARQVISDYSGNISSATAKINELSVDLELAKTKKGNEGKIKSIEDQIEYYKNQREKLKSSMETDALSALENPDAARASLYTNNYIARMSKSLSEVTEEIKYSVSPHFTVEMQLKDYALKQASQNLAVAKFNTEQYWKQREYDQKEKELKLKYGTGTTPLTDLPVDIEGVSAMSLLAGKYDELSRGAADMDAINRKIVIAARRQTQEAKGMSDDDIRKMIEENARAKGMTVNEYYSKTAAALRDEFDKGNSDLYEFRDLFKQRQNLDKELLHRQDVIDSNRKKALERAEAEGIDVSKYSDIMSQVREMDISTSDGKIIKLSKQDIFNIASGSEQGRQELINKYGKIYNLIDLYANSSFDYGSSINPLALNLASEVSKVRRILNSPENQRISEIEAELYKEQGSLPVPKTALVRTGKSDDVDYTAKIVDVIWSRRDKTGFEEFTSQDLLKSAIDNASKVQIDAEEVGGKMEYTLNVIDENGDAHKTKITPANFTNLTNHNPLQITRKPIVVERIDLRHSTSRIENDLSPEAAWFVEDDFEQMKGSEYKVRANLKESLTNPDIYTLELYVKKDGDSEYKRYQIETPINKYAKDVDGNIIEGVYNPNLDILPSAITPAIIEKLVNK